VTRQDGVKEKRAEFTLSRLHPLSAGGSAGGRPPMASAAPSPRSAAPRAAAAAPVPASQAPAWNASPLVPDLPEGEDEIPF
jgi:hypothetical protein